MKINYYEVLGVEKSASEDEIRDRFRKMARESHPDRYRGADKPAAEQKFQKLTEAVNVLTNAARRKQHDSELQSPGGKAGTDPAQIAKVYISRGVKAFKDGDFAAAVENFDMAVNHNQQDAKAYHYLALASARIPSRMRQAVQAIEAAVQKDQYNPLFLKDAGMLCRKAGLTAKAERYFEEALKWDQENLEVLSALDELRKGRVESREGGKGRLESLFKKG